MKEDESILCVVLKVYRREARIGVSVLFLLGIADHPF